MSAYTSEDLVSTISSNVTQITPTATSADERAALTTPYIPPSNCTPNWKKTSLIWTQDGTFTYPVLVSAPPASCYPSGWEISEAQSLFTFSPAVCPFGWDYWKMARSGDSPAVSTAYCCESGFTFDPYDRGGYVANDFFTRGCGRWVQTISDISQRDGTTTTTLSASSNYQDASAMDDTFMVHQAWEISWGSSERSDLTPMPLTLTDGERVSSWKPGETLPDDSRPTESFDQSQGYISTSAVWFLMVGLPIIVFLMIVGCCWSETAAHIGGRERQIAKGD
ncbi:hypothetical protein FOWG_01614 [Fusarium oxysporum f. sp. lycopersici MN25]|uniref:Uncharacterized protein n=1 Tax=Fusarium oxysporum f. sp. cepae TaxID=396571 RepID=A0A3L6NH91_FUSOX|nr:hypothetical protein FOWG_01614 [Fusarium oxysporum f. sp. lycopersici MN25]RKK17605.1 hypothetical protein BFJ65_g7936 [Fusarium oxysporum f. sp. cepae]